MLAALGIRGKDDMEAHFLGRIDRVCVPFPITHETAVSVLSTSPHIPRTYPFPPKKKPWGFGMPLLSGFQSLISIISLILVSFCANSLSYCRDWQSFLKMKCQRINILDFVGHVVSAATIHLCNCTSKAARDNTHGHIPIELYL